ncbi:MAG: hypothetical protein JWM16_6265 [Verrucomicrobiales bacterium]|nr:hypothetical protein [Verrucomicrobiales bacterium]
MTSCKLEASGLGPTPHSEKVVLVRHGNRVRLNARACTNVLPAPLAEIGSALQLVKTSASLPSQFQRSTPAFGRGELWQATERTAAHDHRAIRLCVRYGVSVWR